MQELSTTEMLFLGFIMLNMLYMYIVGKCKIICTSFRNRQGLLFLSISNQGHIKFIFTDNVHISCLSYNVKKSTKNHLPNCLKTRRNKCCSYRIQWCSLLHSCLYCYCFLQSLYMNQVPAKLYFGQRPYITKIYPVNAI